jgi:hypothetical protein
MAKRKRPNRRTAYALIGEFLHLWNDMELCLDDALGAALRLQPAMTFILGFHLDTAKKIFILRCANRLSDVDGPKREKFEKTLNSLSDYLTTRNMIAHTGFQPVQVGKKIGVEFFQVQARGKFKLPDPKWTKSDFQQAYEKIDKFAAGSVALRDHLKHAKFQEVGSRLITIVGLPTSDTYALKIPNPPDRQLPIARNYRPPTPNQRTADRKRRVSGKK